MDFGPFALLSLMYVVIGVRVIAQLVQRGKKVWDHTFTPEDRALVNQAAFFILIPISVALHELGHAIAVHQQLQGPVFHADPPGCRLDPIDPIGSD